VPFGGVRPDHRAGIELAAIDAHRAAESAADLEGGFDDRVAREARPVRNRSSPRSLRGLLLLGQPSVGVDHDQTPAPDLDVAFTFGKEARPVSIY
jgi:hypothetical protein